jgi:hypothetical protein
MFSISALTSLKAQRVLGFSVELIMRNKSPNVAKMSTKLIDYMLALLR